MSKLADKLRAMKVYNNHELLTRFGQGKDVCVEYRAAEGMRVEAPKSTVYSPHFKTKPDSAWYDYGRKAFVGKRSESFDLALEWASKEYGITEWAVSPFGGRVPKSVMDKALAELDGK